MADDILSQEEVDALLRGVTGEQEESGSAESAEQGIRAYDIGRQERIVRGRMPTLELINERFARQFRIGLFNFMRKNAEISVGSVRVVKYSEFVRNLVVPTNLNMVLAKPLRGMALIVIEPALVFQVVDHLFGGSGRIHTRVEGRDFTPTEMRTIQRLLQVIFGEFQRAWEPVYPLTFEYVRSEMNTQFANIATPNEVVVVTTFNIEFGPTAGEFHICMPYAMIEPVRDLLYSSMQGDHLEVDKRWLRLLAQQVQTAEVELIAVLGRSAVTFNQILKMKAGDVIALDIPESIVAAVDGVPVMDCHYGLFNGQYALKVEKMLGGLTSE